jgi:NAD(P)-dependent dehydrogenase (short-subunit alcohol dehydrogenase family)
MTPSHVVITGGASGIGEATALRLAGAGHRVTVLDRTPPGDRPWWAGLAADRRGDWHVVDVTDTAAVTAAVAASARSGHPLDGLVTCAGVVSRESSLDVTDEQFAHTLAVNLWGAFGPARAFARHLVDAGRPGSIVTVASTAGLGYVAGLGAAYHASKAALIGLARSMAGDLARYGIRVNVVAPGVVRTPMTAGQRGDQGEAPLAARAPAGRLAEAAEVAGAIMWLLSPRAALTTGHVLPVDGGQVAVAGAPGGGFPPPAADARAIGHPGPYETPSDPVVTR